MEQCFYFQKPQVPSNASTTKECKLSEKYTDCQMDQTLTLFKLATLVCS